MTFIKEDCHINYISTTTTFGKVLIDTEIDSTHPIQKVELTQDLAIDVASRIAQATALYSSQE